MSSRELTIAYRVCPRLSQGVFRLPAWQKTDLVRVCLDSMVAALDAVDYEFIAVLDDCPDDYVAMLRDRIPAARLRCHRLGPGQGGNNATFQWQLDALTDPAAADAVYAAEDDYLYLPGAFRCLVDRLHDDGVDFVTPYDHPDVYRHSPAPGVPEFLIGLHRYESAVRWSRQRHWRTISSTTCSFMTTPQTLRQTLPAFRLYPTLGDYGMWLAITHKRRCHAGWRQTLAFYRRTPWRLLLGPSRTLWSPIPALATHMVAAGLSPAVDWRQRLQEFPS